MHVRVIAPCRYRGAFSWCPQLRQRRRDQLRGEPHRARRIERDGRDDIRLAVERKSDFLAVIAEMSRSVVTASAGSAAARSRASITAFASGSTGTFSAAAGNDPDPATASAAQSEQHEVGTPSMVDRLAEWIYQRRSWRKSYEALYDEARNAQLGEFRTTDSLTAYRKVYATKPHAPPKTGWPLRSPYKERSK